MKRFGMIALMAASLMGMGSCDIHTSDNGSIDGFWQLVQTDTLANGRSEDMKPRRIFWAVQSDLLKMEELKEEGAYHTILFHFELKDNSLRVYNPVVDRREISDSIVSSVATVSYYGLDGLDQSLRVVQLENAKMTLETERLRMYFRKY